MNLAGELVLGRNQLIQALNTEAHIGIEAVASRLDQVTTELQEAIMRTRMQPIGAVFSKFPRVIRDLGAKLGKQCDIVMDGKEVDVDKTILDAQRLNKYFVKQGAQWRIRDEIRAMCSFSTRNLHDPLTGHGPFDVIFCRNVVIYFTAEDRKNIFTRMSQILQPNGWILVGSSESLGDMGPKWAPQFHCGANCYRPTMAGGASLPQSQAINT